MGWMRIDRVSWAERALWAACVVGSVAPVALAPTREEVAQGYVEAINRGNVEAALGRMAEDVIMRPPLGGQYTGREQARGVLEYRAALHERWEIVRWEFNGQEVHADIEITNDAWSLVGSSPTVSVMLVTRNGLLLLEDSRFNDKPLRRRLEPFLAWASSYRPEELNVVWQQDQPVRRGETALRLVSLLREWRSAGAPVAAADGRGQR